jgi:hypothetical protein
MFAGRYSYSAGTQKHIVPVLGVVWRSALDRQVSPARLRNQPGDDRRKPGAVANPAPSSSLSVAIRTVAAGARRSMATRIRAG